MAGFCHTGHPATAASAVVVSVGPEAHGFGGNDSLALQKAADELARQAPAGGGVLLIKAGTYMMYDSLHLRVPMTVRGEGPATVLKKCPQFRTPLLQDFDLSEYVAKVQDPSGLRVGMGVTFKDQNQDWGWAACVRSIVAIDGSEVRLDRRPERDYALAAGAWLQNSFPIISACQVDGVTIEDLAVDGNRDQNRDVPLDGCRGGGIYLHEARHCTIRRCTARNFCGDGISWQTTEDILVEQCLSAGNKDLGVHPGTGSLRSTVRNCHAHHNGDIGLFLCWNVKFGQFENNVLEDNGHFGISIGHKDTDNLFLNNQIRRNGQGGVLFRDEVFSSAGHRCTFRRNVIEDNGQAGQGGIGVKIQGQTSDTVLETNVVRDTRPPKDRTQQTAIWIGPAAGQVAIAPDNQIDGAVEGKTQTPLWQAGRDTWK